MSQDVLYHNANVLTVDEGCSVQTAFTVRADRFTAVGTGPEFREQAGTAGHAVDLEGRTVIPGLWDTHCHLLSAAVSELYGRIPAVRSVGELLEYVEREVASKQAGEWVTIARCFATRLDELRFPTRAELDRVAPDNPVFVNGTYAGVVNTAGLAAAGFTRATKNPAVLKDPQTGEPNGLLRQSAFARLNIPPAPPVSHEAWDTAARELMRRYNAVGITHVTDCLRTSEQRTRLQQRLQAAADRAEPIVRFLLNIDTGRPPDPNALAESVRRLTTPPFEPDPYLAFGPVKVFLDGGVLTGTAYLREPWGEPAAEIFGVDALEYRGVVNYAPAQLSALVERAAKLGYGFTAHVTGDAGMDTLLDAYETARQSRPDAPGARGAIHANFFRPDILARCCALQVALEIQPAWFYKDADAMVRILGEDRCRHFHAYRTLLDSGVLFCAGSDHMVKLDARTAINPYDPFPAIYAMTTHRTERGPCWFPEQTIGRMDALKAYTRNAALRAGKTALLGSIEPGKFADFAVLEKDFLTCTDEELRDMRVLMTFVGGRPVYRHSCLG